MATVSKEIAEQLIERCKKQKRPRYYCIVRYFNRVFQKYDYVYLTDDEQYRASVGSARAEDEVKILWASESFRRNHPDVAV